MSCFSEAELLCLYSNCFNDSYLDRFRHHMTQRELDQIANITYKDTQRERRRAALAEKKK